MAVRRPVKWNGFGFSDLTSGEMTAIQSEIIRLYGSSPSVTLGVVSSGGSLGTLSDTRLQAGTGQTRTDRFATTAELQDVSTVTVDYSKLDDTSPGTAAIANQGFSWPLYRVSGGLQAMSLTDVYDTFIDPAMSILTGSDGGLTTAGTYTVSTSTSVASATLVSATPFFVDTRANADLYTADGLLETKDQPEVVLNYYLHRYNAASASNFSSYICYQLGGSDATSMSKANIRNQLQSLIKYFMQEEVGYNFSSGTARGTIITNTARTSSKYLTYQAGADDYRAQEVPDYDVSAATISTYRLYILRS